MALTLRPPRDAVRTSAGALTNSSIAILISKTQGEGA
jgi:hypothetical protein